VIGQGVIIPEAEVYKGANSPIGLGFHKNAACFAHSCPREDTCLHLLRDPFVLFGH